MNKLPLHPSAPLREKNCRLEAAIVTAVCVLLLIAFGFLTILSMIQTAVFDESVGLEYERIVFRIDNIPLNLLVTCAFFLALFLLRKTYDFFAKINLRVLEIALALFSAGLAVFWVLSVTSIPFSDSMNIYEAAAKAAQGNFSPLYNGRDTYNSAFYGGHSYFNFYPFQLGFVLFSECVYRVFGTGSTIPLQIINALFLGSAYFALARMTRLIFQRKSTEFFVILLLAGCLQPVLLCTFAYGNVIGMSAAIWASLLLVKYLRSNRYRWLVASMLTLTFSTLIKYNNLIYLVAFAIVLTVHAVKRRKWQSLAFALAMCVMCVGATRLVILSYELRSDTDIESGLSQVMYLDLGLQESSMSAGWFTKTAIEDYEDGGYDTAKANAIAIKHIDKKVKEFLTHPIDALDFFSRKYLSQWNEPSYESVWVSQVKKHAQPLGDFAQDVYTGTAGKLLQHYYQFAMQIVFLLFTVGILLLFLRRNRSIEAILLPLVVLGAIGYHLLFEAKSQYAATYIPLLLPTAAYAIEAILSGGSAHHRLFRRKTPKKTGGRSN